MVEDFVLDELFELDVDQKIIDHFEPSVNCVWTLQWLSQPSFQTPGAYGCLTPIQDIEYGLVAHQQPFHHLFGEDLQRLDRRIIQPHKRTQVQSLQLHRLFVGGVSFQFDLVDESLK